MKFKLIVINGGEISTTVEILYEVQTKGAMKFKE